MRYLITLHPVGTDMRHYAATVDGREYVAWRNTALNVWSAHVDGAWLGLHPTLPAARRAMEKHLVGRRQQAA